MGVPHCMQNRLSAATGAPHWVQSAAAAGGGDCSGAARLVSALPHRLQKFFLPGLEAPQLLHWFSIDPSSWRSAT
jgi:hypothetical protein